MFPEGFGQVPPYGQYHNLHGRPGPNASQNPPPDESGRVSVGKKLGGVILGFIAVIGCVAGTVSAVIDFRSSRPPSLDEWSRAANSACERDFQGIAQPLITVFPLISQMMTQVQSGQKVNLDDATEISEQTIQISGAFRKLSGDLRVITVPGGGHRPKIDELVKAGDQMSNIFAAISVTMSRWAANTVTVDELSQTTTAMAGFDDLSQSWLTLTVRLRVPLCGFFAQPSSSSSALVIPSRTPQPSHAQPFPSRTSPTPRADESFTSAERSLVRMIRSDRLTRCAPARSITTAGVLAAVNCSATVDVPRKRPLVMKFEDTDGLTRWLHKWGSDVTHSAGSHCVDGSFNSGWRHNGVRIGSLVCEKTDPNGFRIAWTFDSYKIAVVASGTDGVSLGEWWSHNAYLINE